ncbi:MAG: ASCH domain-containing protein [Rhizobiaceae bacterium]
MTLLEELRRRYSDAETYRFGDSKELSEELIALVRSGKKTATCEPLRTFENGDEAMPQVGRFDITLDWDGNPALVTETTDVTVCRFCDVDEDFALAEGENDSLDGWRDDHRQYFERNGGWTSEMKLVCERFRLVEDLQAIDE